jgi:hypothetical protein
MSPSDPLVGHYALLVTAVAHLSSHDSPVEGDGFEPSVPLRNPRADGRLIYKSSRKVRDTHSVGAISDHNLGVFTVTEIAMENTGAVPPVHPLPRTPKAEYPGLQRCRTPSVPLTCLAQLAAWQSLCTGHVENPIRSGRHRPPSGRQAVRPSGRQASVSTRQVGGLSLESHNRRSRTFFRSGVHRPPLDPSYHRLRRRRLAGPQSSPRSPRGPAPKRAQRYPCRPDLRR